MASKASLENQLRNKFLSFVSDTISQEMETDVLVVGAGELAIPCLDDEGNEKFVKICISIPRGERDGKGGYIPYDGYAVSEAYLGAIASKEQERAVKRAMKNAEKSKKKEE